MSKTREKGTQKNLRAAIVVVVIPFGISAIMTIVGWLQFAEAWAVSGFVYLFVAIFLIITIPITSCLRSSFSIFVNLDKRQLARSYSHRFRQ